MKRFVHQLIWVVFIASGLLAVLISWSWLGVFQQNTLISELLEGRDAAVVNLSSAPPEVRLARAVYLVKQHRPEDALATLSAILDQGDSQLQGKTRYNLGNLYLSQAIAQVDAARTDEARTSVTLAKQVYKQALQRDSQFWDAKYNLETAMRLLPDFDRINIEDESGQQPKNPLWTTVPGFPRGLP
jgi:mxaK protein